MREKLSIVKVNQRIKVRTASTLANDFVKNHFSQLENITQLTKLMTQLMPTTIEPSNPFTKPSPASGDDNDSFNKGEYWSTTLV